DCKPDTADQTDQQFWAAQLAAAATEEVASNSPSLDGCSSATDGMADVKPRKECLACGLVFLDPTLYFLHKGLHSDSDPWKCNLCGHECQDKYQFHTHVISADHS
uniref:C2H2-type domain-containing protein n=1 Tax=Plectus sambesii TaxID=2011161 RepID=A0A914URJ9_9BILA